MSTKPRRYREVHFASTRGISELSNDAQLLHLRILHDPGMQGTMGLMRQPWQSLGFYLQLEWSENHIRPLIEELTAAGYLAVEGIMIALDMRFVERPKNPSQIAGWENLIDHWDDCDLVEARYRELAESVHELSAGKSQPQSWLDALPEEVRAYLPAPAAIQGEQLELTGEADPGPEMEADTVSHTVVDTVPDTVSHTVPPTSQSPTPNTQSPIPTSQPAAVARERARPPVDDEVFLSDPEAAEEVIEALSHFIGVSKARRARSMVLGWLNHRRVERVLAGIYFPGLRQLAQDEAIASAKYFDPSIVDDGGLQFDENVTAEALVAIEGSTRRQIERFVAEGEFKQKILRTLARAREGIPKASRTAGSPERMRLGVYMAALMGVQKGLQQAFAKLEGMNQLRAVA